MPRNFVVSGNTLSVFLDGELYTIPSSHKYYKDILEALPKSDVDNSAIIKLIDLPKVLKTIVAGRVEVKERKVYLDGIEMNSSLAYRIVRLVEGDEDGNVTPLLNFLNLVADNPSRTAIEGLYDWLSRSNLPIFDDGYIMAWKIVDEDYFDLYTAGDRKNGDFSKSYRHQVGDTPEMPRSQVDDDASNTCSHGLHFCSTSYLPHYGTKRGARVMIVRINPADVVAFPKDYNTSKGRTWRLEVIAEADRERSPELYANANVISTADVKARQEFKVLVDTVKDADLTYTLLNFEEPELAVMPEEKKLIELKLLSPVQVKGLNKYQINDLGRRVFNELTKIEE